MRLDSAVRQHLNGSRNPQILHCVTMWWTSVAVWVLVRGGKGSLGLEVKV
jgi:hypothetical protein